MALIPLVFLLAADEGDRAFMESAYTQYHRLMYAQAYRILNHSQAAEDAVSESLLALMKKISLLRTLDSNKLRAYFVITVRHTAVTMLNRKKRERIDGNVTLEELAGSGQVEDQLLSEAGIEQVKSAVRALPPREQDIMMMRYFREMTDEEIAEALGLKAVSVRVHLTRARKHLAELLGERRENP